MDNNINELYYADINSKQPQFNINTNNTNFGEIGMKKGNYGFVKLIILLILFILLLVLIIVAITSTNSISSTEQKIKENEDLLNSNKKIFVKKQNVLYKMEKNNNDLKINLDKLKKDKEMMDNNIKKFYDDNDKLNNDIKELEKDVEDLKKEIKVYDGYQKSELQLEYENLIEKIERLRQTPM